MMENGGLPIDLDPVRRLARLRDEIHARHVRLESAPATINIELTGRCNFKPACTFCVGKNAPDYEEPGHMCSEQLARYWPDLLRAQRVNDCSYGETLLYPELDQVIERLTSTGVRFGFTTNGLLLSERRARFLIEHGETVELVVSLNAATRDTFWALHGQNFGRIVGNVERFVQIHRTRRPGRPVPLYLSFIVMRSNRHEVLDFLRLAMTLGVEQVILRHLFDLRVGDFNVESFGHHFVYEDERLPYADYVAIEADIRGRTEFAALGIHFAWNAGNSFIAQQAEPGVDIPCLFPWKFLCVRPLHNSYAPCVYLKKSIAPPSATTIDEVWNGPVMVGIRTSLAAGAVPDFCMTYGDACPLVLERRAQQAAPAADPPAEDTASVPSPPEAVTGEVPLRAPLPVRIGRRISWRWAAAVRQVRLWQLARREPRLKWVLFELRQSSRVDLEGWRRRPRALPDLFVALLCDGGEISDATFVERCYERVLRRTPDGEGFQSHLEALAAGHRRAQVVEAMLTSAEFRRVLERWEAGRS
jgi:MoaA/NifB/PqqE/SkfB family radical SAM enzyme